MAPEYGSQDYWDERFSKNGRPFEWLQPLQFIRDVAYHWVGEEPLLKAEILHVGCGTSDSSILREMVAEPRQIHNVDFSQAAIDAGSQRERELLENKDPELVDSEDKHDSFQVTESMRTMLWSRLDLLSLNSTLDLIEQQAEVGRLFDVVLDKGTSDSVALLKATALRLPYPLSINGWTRGVLQSTTQTAEVHPLHVLAVHLAALTRPRTSKWLCISYSEDRFPFLPPYPHTESHGLLTDSTIKAGFPHPGQLWRLEAKEKIGLPDEGETLAQRKKRMSSGVVFRPQLSHWLYVLVRTDAVVTY